MRSLVKDICVRQTTSHKYTTIGADIELILSVFYYSFRSNSKHSNYATNLTLNIKSQAYPLSTTASPLGFPRLPPGKIEPQLPQNPRDLLPRRCSPTSTFPTLSLATYLSGQSAWLFGPWSWIFRSHLPSHSHPERLTDLASLYCDEPLRGVPLKCSLVDSLLAFCHSFTKFHILLPS